MLNFYWIFIFLIIIQNIKSKENTSNSQINPLSVKIFDKLHLFFISKIYINNFIYGF